MGILNKVQVRTIDKNIINQIVVDSALRVRNVLMALGLMQMVQLILYLTGSNELLKTPILIALKLTMVSFALISFFVLNLIDKRYPFFYKHGETVVAVIVLFTITAVARLRLWLMISIYAVCYGTFIIGIPYFQKDSAFLTSHQMNGTVLTIVAVLIAHMLYKYAVSDYFVKQDINKKNRELLFLAQRDGLTCLYNHKTIHELLEKIILGNENNRKSVFLLLLDLDNFKAINDRFGHKFGDSILKQTANIITATMNENNIIGRYGGDEFMVIMPDTDILSAELLASKLLNEIGLIEIDDFEMTFSCGIALWEGETSDKLVEKADQLMYKSKADGRNMVTVNCET
jgi:diguanylate cyclase (GGDEF)-like protein